MNKYRHVEHTFGPVYDSQSRILILGSFPSVKSREINFYYGIERHFIRSSISQINQNI